MDSCQVNQVVNFVEAAISPIVDRLSAGVQYARLRPGGKYVVGSM